MKDDKAQPSAGFSVSGSLLLPFSRFPHHLGHLAFLHKTIDHQNQRLLVGVWQIIGLLAQCV
jgi:hypothetical protein